MGTASSASRRRRLLTRPPGDAQHKQAAADTGDTQEKICDIWVEEDGTVGTIFIYDSMQDAGALLEYAEENEVPVKNLTSHATFTNYLVKDMDNEPGRAVTRTVETKEPQGTVKSGKKGAIEAKAPKHKKGVATGDGQQPLIWLGVAAVAAGALAGIRRYRRRS